MKSNTVTTLAVFLGLPICALSIWLHLGDYKWLADVAIRKVAQDRAAMNSVNPADTKLVFCGTGSPATTAERGSPCLALIHDGRLFLFDAGEGSFSKLVGYQLPILKLDQIFLTHLHSDHVSGLGEVLHNSWLNGRTHRVTTWGPPGTKGLLRGVAQVYGPDAKERELALAEDDFDATLAFGESKEVRIENQGITTIFEEGGLKVEAFPVDHPEWDHAYGYRLHVAGKVIVISGDTKVSENVRAYAQNADILIHEALNVELISAMFEALSQAGFPATDSRLQSIVTTHTNTFEIANLAKSASVGHLYLTHLIPPIPDNYVARKAFTSDMDASYGGSITVASDGLEIELSQ